ncbi:hypothetical protein ABE530_15260 [Brucella sp. TWI559]
MAANYSFIPTTALPVQLGRAIQHIITITLDSGTFPKNPIVTLTDVINFEIYSPSVNNEKLIYRLDVIIDPENDKKGTATFYSTVKTTAPVGSIAQYRATYGVEPSLALYRVADLAHTTSTNPTEYLFTVKPNDPVTDPDNNPDNTATYNLKVVGADNLPIAFYDIFWSDKIKTGVLEGSNVYTDGTPDPTDPTKKTYKILSPLLDVPKAISPSGAVVYHTTTDVNGETTLYVTAKDAACNGVPYYFASLFESQILGTITIYDPNNPRLFIPDPYIINPSYNGQYLNLDAMSDPLLVSLDSYYESSGTDTVNLVSNGMLTDSSSFQELVGTRKLLKLPKTTLYTTQSSTPSPFNKLFFVIAANDGTVRTSVYNTFRAIGSNMGPNQPDYSIPRYSPAADLPYVLGAYITADSIIGGVQVYYRFTNQNWVPKAGDILTATYYLNGYQAGTEVKRMNKIVRPGYIITTDDIKRGYYIDELAAAELHGYSKSVSGRYQKLYVEYTINFMSVAPTLKYFAINDFFYLSTVAPGDFG